MAQLIATVALLAILAGVAKMVWDVQRAKIYRFFKEIERMQILAGIKPYNKEKGEKDLAAKLTGVNIDGIEQLAERFQTLAHIKESSETTVEEGETTIYKG